MTEYEPGRIYSGVINDERVIFLADTVDDRAVCWMYKRRTMYQLDAMADVRGPLVVLDLEGTGWTWGGLVSRLRADDFHSLADQIEQQTRPPLQIGWHEVEDCRQPLYWDGDHWSIGPWAECPTASQGYLSTHYIGPGSDQS